MPEQNAIAWHAYLAGLLEWNVISIGMFDKLLLLLPDTGRDPAISILSGLY
jgi:hypothetical protein